MLNKHGLIMRGIKAVSGETEKSADKSWYMEIFYHRITGHVWGIWHYDIARRTYAMYRDPDCISVCHADAHMSMQDIADRIAYRIKIIDKYKSL